MKKGLLIGAGFSYDLGMPLVADLTPKFLELFDERGLQWLVEALSGNLSIPEFPPNRPINKAAIEIGANLLRDAIRNQESNYEKIIAKYEKMEGIKSPTQSDRDSYHYLHTFLYGVIQHLFQLYQDVSYEIIYPTNKECFLEFRSLLAENETWVFSLNHDLLVECLAIDLNIPITYGSTSTIKFPLSNLEMEKQIEFGTAEPYLPENRGAVFFNNTAGINLVKLHGGLGEFQYKDKKIQCNLSLHKPSSKALMNDFQFIQKMGYYDIRGKVPESGRHRVITNMDGELDILVNSLLTGEDKFSKTSNPKKGEEKLQLFDDVLNGLDELTIIGYGFGDRHINFRISNALVQNPNLQIRIVDPHWHPIPQFLEQFDYNERIGRVICSAAQWMYYSKYKSWNTAQTEALRRTDREAITARVNEKLNQQRVGY